MVNFYCCAKIHLNWRGLSHFPPKDFLNIILNVRKKSESVFYLNDCCLLDHNENGGDNVRIIAADIGRTNKEI